MDTPLAFLFASAACAAMYIRCNDPYACPVWKILAWMTGIAGTIRLLQNGGNLT